MSATFLTLYDFEGQIETAAAGIMSASLTTFGLSANVSTSQQQPTKDTPFIEILFNPGRAMEQRTAAGQASPKIVPNAFQGTLYVTIGTTRPFDQALSSPLHPQLRSLVRYTFSAGAKLFNSTNLPYLQILDMLPESAPHTIFDEKQQDITTIAFFVQFAINNSAWPTSS